jgi:CubicO group peptidase (beta-lactamase class C family)
VWAGGFGFADLEAGSPMTPDTVQNVGSVSKTVTATAVLQLVERGRLDLNADVNNYLSFAVRNPRHPTVRVTARQLLAHRSSVRDGPRAYSNVGYGLLGHLVERASGREFADYCRAHIFGPLAMRSSSFRIRDVGARHAVPYFNRVPHDFDLAKSRREWASDARLARYPFDERPPAPGQLFAYCAYGFATPPDGGLRTGVHDLARFLPAWIGRGSGRGQDGRGVALLRPETVDMALSPDHFGRMLCWDRLETFYSSKEAIPGEPWIHHDGSDPGVGALAAFRPRDRSGMILVFNSSGKTRALLDAGMRALLQEL